MVRCFENDDVVHVAGRVDPLSDIDVIDTELALADLATLEKGLERAAKAAKGGDKDAIAPSRAASNACKRISMRCKPARAMQLTMPRSGAICASCSC